MIELIKKSPIWSSIIALAIINILAILFRLPKMLIGNIDFLVGLFLIVLGSNFYCWSWSFIHWLALSYPKEK